MLDGVLNQDLQGQGRNRHGFQLPRYVNDDLQPIPEPGLLDAQVALHEGQLLLEGDRGPLGDLDHLPEELGETLRGSLGGPGIVLDLGVQGVQGIEDEVGRQLGAQGRIPGQGSIEALARRLLLGVLEALERQGANAGQPSPKDEHPSLGDAWRIERGIEP